MGVETSVGDGLTSGVEGALTVVEVRVRWQASGPCCSGCGDVVNARSSGSNCLCGLVELDPLGCSRYHLLNASVWESCLDPKISLPAVVYIKEHPGAVGYTFGKRFVHSTGLCHRLAIYTTKPTQ
jgi:hypothetical protein